MNVTPLQVVAGLMACWIAGFAAGHIVMWVRALKDAV